MLKYGKVKNDMKRSVKSHAKGNNSATKDFCAGDVKSGGKSFESLKFKELLRKEELVVEHDDI